MAAFTGPGALFKSVFMVTVSSRPMAPPPAVISLRRTGLNFSPVSFSKASMRSRASEAPIPEPRAAWVTVVPTPIAFAVLSSLLAVAMALSEAPAIDVPKKGTTLPRPSPKVESPLAVESN